MNDDAITRFEAQAVETLASLKELFREFEKQLGETVSAQRLASSEARSEAAGARAALGELVRHARATAGAQTQVLKELREGWQMHVAENSKAAGAEMALTFGEEIAAGLEKRLAGLAREAETATRRLTWRTNLRWALALAIAIPLTVDVGIHAFMPTVADLTISGLTIPQTHEVLSRITLCWPKYDDLRDAHVCVMTDDPPRLTRGPHGEAVVIARGM